MMAEACYSGVLAEPDRDLDFSKLKSAWIGRFRFSKSISHRLDLSLPSAIKFKPKLNSRGSFEDNGSDFFSSFSSSKCSTRSPSGPLSFRSVDEDSYSSSSAGSSPGTSNPSSFGSFRRHAESSDRDRSHKVKRATSSLQSLGGSFRYEMPTLDPAAELWVVNMSQLFLGQKFAAGSYSRLYYGLYRCQEVAVKLIRPPDEDEAMALRLESQFRHEAMLLSRLHHPNVVQFVAAFKKPAVFGIITEYLPNGSLRSFLNKRGPDDHQMKVIIRMALDIARGMEHLHSQGVIHRDLKSENLCLDKDSRVKITDFGSSCHFTEDYIHTKDTGTYRWMAPEMINQKPYTKKVDVYSFGIVLWELLTGLIPFKNMTAAQAAFAVVNKRVRPEVYSSCPPILGELMRQCWSSNPKRRPDFWEIVKRLEQIEESWNKRLSFSTLHHPAQHANFISRCLNRDK